MTDRPSETALARLRRRSLLACAAILIPGAALLAMPVHASVMAPAVLAPETGSRAVLHREGGRAAEILVKDGDRVVRGQVLLRLDATEARAALLAVEQQIAAVEARMARLEAEVAGASSVAVPPSWLALEEETSLWSALESERAVFAAEALAREAERGSRAARLGQINAELDGLVSLKAARVSEREILSSQLEALEGLLRKGLTTMPRVNAVRRDSARVDGDLAQIASEAARLTAERDEIKNKDSEADAGRIAKSAEDLADTRATLAELRQRRRAAQERVTQLDIAAPVDGVVHGLATQAGGGTIPPGATVAKIVPSTDDLVAELRVPARDIDRVKAGDTVRIRLSAGPARLAQPVEARLTFIAPDATVDPESGAAWYAARASFDRAEAERVAGVPLGPGMAGEAALGGAPRSIAAYLIEPLADHAGRALRER